MTKIGVVECQLDMSVILFFEQINIIACETLVSNALGILRALVEKENINSPIWNSDYIKEEYKREWKKNLNMRSNYLKHADKDSDLEFEPEKEVVRVKLVEATYLYTELSRKINRIKNKNIILFQYWFSLKYPEMMEHKSPYWDNIINESREKNIDPDDFGFFYRLSIINRII